MTLAARECSVKEREAENKKTELHSKILTTRTADMIRCSNEAQQKRTRRKSSTLNKDGFKNRQD